MNIIEVENLTHDYGHDRGVFDVSFAVKPGEVFGFLGPNGAGKSTTIRHIMGFSRPQKGENCQGRRIRRLQRPSENPREHDKRRHRVRRPRICRRHRKAAFCRGHTAKRQEHHKRQIPDCKAAFYVHKRIPENGGRHI